MNCFRYKMSYTTGNIVDIFRRSGDNNFSHLKQHSNI